MLTEGKKIMAINEEGVQKANENALKNEGYHNKGSVVRDYSDVFAMTQA